MPHERSPTDILLGALNMVAAPLVCGDDSEEMRETAQFYGYEDWPGCFKNTSPRITELVAYRPTPDQPGCVIEISTPRFLLPGAFARATRRWTKMRKMARTAPNAWRDAEFALTLETHRRDGKTHARLVLSRA